LHPGEDQDLIEGTEYEGGSVLRLFSLTLEFPAVGKKLIDLRSRSGRHASQQVLGVFHGIDADPVAGLDNAHPDCGGAAAFNGPGEEPVLFPEHGGAKSIFGVVIVGCHEAGARVETKSVPVSNAVTVAD